MSVWPHDMKNMIQPILASGLGLMLLSAIIFSFTDVFIKYLSSSFSATQIAFIRFFLGGFILWPLLSSKGVSLRGNQTRILILRGFFGTLSFFFLLKSIGMIPLSNAIVLHYTFPLFAALFSLLFFKIALERGEIILILMGLIGIYILTNPDFHSFNNGYLYGFLSGCFGGLAMVLAHKARQTNSPFVIYFYFCLIGGMITFPFVLQNFKVPGIQNGILLVLIAVLLLIGQVVMNQGLRFCKASEGSLILMSEVVFTGIASSLIFKDPVTWNLLAGALLIIGSGIGLNLMSRVSRHPPVS
jgi:drug/metabolite transporter (DMT)-like permease